VLAPTPSRALALADEISLYTAGLPVYRLPEREGLPYELTRDDDSVRFERERALAVLNDGGRAVVVASWAALSSHCASPERVAEALEVRQGATLSPAALLSLLEQAGYEIDTIADQHGRAARHGGIVDIYPPGSEHPYRIEFFGDEIESIRRVQIESQRSIERVDSARFPPAATGTRGAHEAARALLAQLDAEGAEAEMIIEELELVAEGDRGEHDGFLEAILFDTSGLDYLSGSTLVVVDDLEGGHDALTTAAEHEQRAREEQETRGRIPRGLPPLRVGASSVAAAIREHEQVIAFDRFGDEAAGTLRLPFRVTPAFAGRIRPLAEQARAWAHEGRAVVLASQQALRLSDLFEQDGIAVTSTRTVSAAPEPGVIMLTPVAAGGGFSMLENLVTVTDAEIFGFRKQRRPMRTRRGIRSDLLAQIEVGEFVVHADHGIAQFGGLVRRTVDGGEREYLELRYAEGDRLLVPAENLDAITRYVGPGDQRPALTRLDSQDWARAKRRVRQSVLELAQDLIELYAKRESQEGFAFPPDHPWQMELEAAFPFVETADQLAAIAEIKQDMESRRPMDRLLCGDVGYGKTEVAIRAAFKAVMAGKQVAVLVPTTVLAEQHGRTFRERTAGFPVRVEVLSRFRSEHEQREITAALAKGDIDIVIGTHRLLQNDVQYRDLGLVIVDEEQRFGVSHKERLKQMRTEVDVLTLSATPIPRTLQMSLTGIRDMSTVMTPPEERLPIRTYVTEWDDEIVREAIDRELQRGGQVYFVHNRVYNIEMVLEKLREILPEARIAVGHGQMPEEQLERVMAEFGAGEHDVLVCTTIIESGIDIPNVNTIIINHANQLGLAQLYQLRGRVGRSAAQAYTYLMYDRNRAVSETAQKRMEAIFEASELGAGFQIALRDLEIRGAGNLLGTAQSGHIAAVGFELYSKLVAETVEAIKRVMRPDEMPPAEPLTPVPSIDLPVSAHIPEHYLPDLNHRLALYQRIAELGSVADVAAMREELADRYGAPPPAVENLLYVALVKSLARRARVASVKTSQPFIHIQVYDETTRAQRDGVARLQIPGLIPGPTQVRLDRVAVGESWMQVLIRVLRAMVIRDEPARAAQR